MSKGAVRASKRFTVCERDGRCCHYCGKATPFGEGCVDHIVPESRGGRDANWNLAWSCADCNQAKDNAMPTCGCGLCLHAVAQHLRLGVRPSHYLTQTSRG